ncbi:MAG: SMI1/KNR4 family protein [Chitinophagaceae bacterium]|uniref:SMI1/KNR4 family protein n=1 Tax=unclassified Paraflavitalea TaxID=2798305 RepID=UPI003D33A108|nr:SMI1/KNR4 family protein [Chitinophagaceae bacterium]
MDIEQLKDYLIQKGCKLKGCTKKEIYKIEEVYNVALPKAYKRFLEIMGKGAGNFMRGSSAFYNEIFDLREESIELVEKSFGRGLPENSFVFFMHQGYQFAFFYVQGSEDPPVYYFSEGSQQSEFIELTPSFTDFLVLQTEASGL